MKWWSIPFGIPARVCMAVAAGPCLAAGLLSGGAAAHAAMPPVVLAGHHAIYDLTLESVGGGDTVAASGTMSFAVTDACTAWSTQQKLRLQTVSRSGGTTDLVSDYATLEAKDGHHLVFRTVQTSNGAPVTQVGGEATMAASGGEIRYSQPAGRVMPLPAGTLFPMAHTAAIVRAAEAGETSIAPLLFDGTGADGPQYTYVMMMGWTAPPSDSPFAALSRLSSGRVHVAFYTPSSHDMRPDYAIGMRYFANGVSDRLDMDFGDFRMRGTLRSFTPAPETHRC
ncbi:cell envelope integrity EipB family protein [Gluconacetobacter tumulisoli]|uniref:Cell envelope integrity EipB family protein n=2 Tax=Gluconacetobacter tumulisoli TaxID=1286189 RepID=A0A7W4PM53_9PROT|nr:cell envelope integrity EipB family protein [Gluconacetobacter tumulisoli]